MNKLIIFSGLLTVLILLSGCATTGKVTQSAGIAPMLLLTSTNDKPINVDKVIIDGQDLGAAPEGKITIEGIPNGTHKLIIIFQGATFSKQLNFQGDDVLLKLDNPINVTVSVWSKIANIPLKDIKIFIDEEGIKCTTNEEGVCSFLASPDKHTFKVQAEGVYLEEIKTISKDSDSFTFKVEATGEITIKVVDDLGNNLSGAQVSLDGFPKGLTSTNGTFSIRNVDEGDHIIEISYKEVSEKANVFVPSDEITIKLKTPKKIEIKVMDKLSGQPVSGAEVWLDSLPKGITNSSGSIKLSDIKQGSHVIAVKYKEINESQPIDVSTTNLLFTIKMVVPKTVTIKILDLEVKKPVDGAKVFLDGSEVGITIQTGEVIVKDILPGTYTLSLEQLSFAAYGFTGAPPSTRITIGIANSLTTEVNMPNPIFKVNVSCEDRWTIYGVVGNCKVTIQNLGKINSQFTHAQVLLYPICEGEYPANPAKQLSLNFTTISPGQSKTIDTKDVYGEVDAGFNWSCNTDVVVIVKDGWKYTPEDTQVIGMQSSLLEQWVVEAKTACFADAEQCANVAGVFVGSAIRAATPLP